jgi:hypothetical protein
MFSRAGCSLSRAEGISCSLCVLYGGLGITKLQFFFSAVHFFQFLVIKTLDPDPYPDPQLGKMLDPDPHKINADHNPGWMFSFEG